MVHRLIMSLIAFALVSPVAFGAAKYGVVDMQTVILSIEEGKKARADLEKEIKAKEKDLLSQRDELEKLSKQFEEQAALLSEQARLEKQKQAQQKFLALRQAEMEFQAEMKRKEAQATQKLFVKVAGVVEEIARREKLDAVFETNSAGLLYLSSPVDLTRKVIDEYEKSKVAKASPKK